jgi:hypothetical protein
MGKKHKHVKKFMQRLMDDGFYHKYNLYSEDITYRFENDEFDIIVIHYKRKDVDLMIYIDKKGFFDKPAKCPIALPHPKSKEQVEEIFNYMNIIKNWEGSLPYAFFKEYYTPIKKQKK